MSRRSSNVEPTTLPAPAMFSSTGLTVEVAARARLSAEAMREMAAGRGCGPVEPGLGRERLGVSGGDEMGMGRGGARTGSCRV